MSEIAAAVYSEKAGLGRADALAAPLNPNYQYLRVALSGAPPALLVLGYLDSHPQGDIEVWYSSKGEVLKLQNGRLVGATGLAVEWRRVVYPEQPPAWQSVPSVGVQYARVRDEYPGYRLGLIDQVFLTHLKKLPLELPTDAPANATWYQESYSDASGTSVPAAWFALGKHGGQATIVYSRQCLSVNVCLTLQRWPLQKDSL